MKHRLVNDGIDAITIGTEYACVCGLRGTRADVERHVAGRKRLDEYVQLHEIAAGDERRDQLWKGFTDEERDEVNQRLRTAMHERNARHAVQILESLPEDVRERVLAQFRGGAS